MFNDSVEVLQVDIHLFFMILTGWTMPMERPMWWDVVRPSSIRSHWVQEYPMLDYPQQRQHLLRERPLTFLLKRIISNYRLRRPIENRFVDETTVRRWTEWSIADRDVFLCSRLSLTVCLFVSISMICWWREFVFNKFSNYCINQNYQMLFRSSATEHFETLLVIDASIFRWHHFYHRGLTGIG